MKTIAAALLIAAASIANAQAPDPSGHWKGTIDIPNNPADFEIDLATNARGGFIGTATAGVDSATIPLLSVSVSGRTIAFYGRSDQPFDGELSQDGQTMIGTATLNGYRLPFSMSRSGDAKIIAPPTNRAVSEALAGVWNGSLQAGGRALRLVVTITNQADGSATARVVSIDEGGMTLPLAVAENGRDVILDIRGVASSFAGTLNETGTTLAGIWTQGGASLPLTLTRAAAETR
jgi:hypothetical protein